VSRCRLSVVNADDATARRNASTGGGGGPIVCNNVSGTIICKRVHCRNFEPTGYGAQPVPQKFGQRTRPGVRDSSAATRFCRLSTFCCSRATLL
jgi:hypothetical protein